MVLVTSEQMQQFDRRTISSLCVPGMVLMDHAGKAIAEAVRRRQPTSTVLVCGKGNNGGDGWVAARWLRHWGVGEVDVISLLSATELVDPARTAATMALASGVRWRVWDGGELPSADVYVDALLGTGSHRSPRGQVLALVNALNRCRGWVVAADIPTGVDATSGEVAGEAVRADETICLAARKLGTAVTPGSWLAGRVQVADIGIRIDAGPDLARLVTADSVRDLLPKRDATSHKGSFGRVGVLAGEMTGAAVLAGLGAARAGAGLVVLAVRSQPPGVPWEFVVRTLPDPPALSVFADCQALVVGPGLGSTQATFTAADTLPWQQFAGPGVLDADGLRWLLPDGVADVTDTAAAVDRPPLHRIAGWVLTPHPKECARLLGWKTVEVQAQRVLAATTLAKCTGAVVLLKGDATVIADASGQLRVNSSGDASLATAGSGDVLAGVIGALLAQGLPPLQAAMAGAWIHGCAGELAGAERSKAATMASDVVENISRAIHLHFDSTPGD